MPIEEALAGLAASLTASLTGPAAPAPGDPVRAAISPRIDTISVTDILPGDLDVTWITKDVVYGTSDPEASLERGPLTGATVAGQPVAGGGALIPPGGTPGLLATLKGTIPFVTTLELPVGVEVAWRVYEKVGTTERPLAEGSEYETDGLNQPEVSVLLAPLLVPPGGGMATKVYLRAKVTLTVAGKQAERELPELPIELPAIEALTVLAGFRHSRFLPEDNGRPGAVLLVVPDGSPFKGLAELQFAFDRLHGTLSRLARFGNFVAFLTGLSELRRALAAHGGANIEFREASELSDLHDIKLIDRIAFDVTAGDELSAFILLGMPGTAVEFFQHDTFNKNDEGKSFKLATGPGLVGMIRTLHGEAPAADVGTVTGDMKGLGDEISSLRFA